MVGTPNFTNGTLGTVGESLWGTASREFAQSLSGDIKVIASSASPLRIFAGVALPALLANPNVTSIGGQAMATLKTLPLGGALEAVQQGTRLALADGLLFIEAATGKLIASREGFARIGITSATVDTVASLTASGLRRFSGTAIGLAATILGLAGKAAVKLLTTAAGGAVLDLFTSASPTNAGEAELLAEMRDYYSDIPGGTEAGTVVPNASGGTTVDVDLPDSPGQIGMHIKLETQGNSGAASLAISSATRSEVEIQTATVSGLRLKATYNSSTHPADYATSAMNKLRQLGDWLDANPAANSQFRNDPIYSSKVQTDFARSIQTVLPTTNLSNLSIPDLLKAGELIGSGGLASNIAGDFLNGISKGTVSPFNQADVDFANKVAAQLPPGGIAEFLASANGQRLQPGKVDPKIAAAWDIAKTIQNALQSNPTGLLGTLKDDIGNLSSRLAASGNAVAALPLLGNLQTRDDVWNAVRRSMSILDAGRNIRDAATRPPTNAGALTERDSMVNSGVPVDIANQAGWKAQVQFENRVSTTPTTAPPPTFNDIKFDLNSCTGPNAFSYGLDPVPGITVVDPNHSCIVTQSNGQISVLEKLQSGQLVQVASGSGIDGNIFIGLVSPVDGSGSIDTATYTFGGVDGTTPTMVAAKLTAGQTITANYGADGVDKIGGGAGNDTLEIKNYHTKISAAPPTTGGPPPPPPAPPVITAGQIGSIFGSSIGNYIGGGNQFTQIAAGSALATILGSVGTSFDLYFDTAGTGAAPSLTDAIAAGFSNFAPNLGNAVLSQSVGSISNFLTGELSASLGLGHDAARPGRRYGDNAMRSPARGLLPHGDSQVVARGRAGASFDDYSANFAPDAANDNAPAPLALAA